MGRRASLIRSVLTLAAAGTLWLPTTAVGQGVATPDSPRRVEVLLYLIDLIEITGFDQSFFADFYMEASWHDPGLAGGSEERRKLDLDDVWNPALLVVNLRSASRSLPAVVRVDPEGNVSYTQRFTGRFSAPMNLRNFPLDEQRLHLWLVATDGPIEEVELVQGEASILRAERLSITDWDVGEIRFEQADYSATPNAVAISGLSLSIDVDRRVEYYIIQVLIPLIAIVMMSWSVYWVDSSVVATRMGVAVTTMLTLIAYRFMLGNLVPRLSYLTRLDYFMFGATTLVILTLFVMAGTSYLKSRGRDAAVARIDSFGRMAFPVIFALFTLVVWVL